MTRADRHQAPAEPNGPAATPSPARVASHAGISSGTKRTFRALLVDDDEFVLVAVGDLLRELGAIGVNTAANGARAMEAYDRASPKPDVVVCDLNMPVCDGFEFMQQLGAKGYTGGVVLLSGTDDRALKSAALMARFHRLQLLAALTKPVDKAPLRAALAKLA